MIGGTSGESEERIREIFESAMADSPSVLFIDALDVIAAKKDVRKSYLVNQLLNNFYYLYCEHAVDKSRYGP